MPRWEKTNLTRSTNLRNAMIQAGFDTAIRPGQKFYEPDGTLHLAVTETDGFIVSVTQNAVFSEMFQPTEELIRCFIITELEAWVNRNIAVESSNAEPLQNGNWRYRITVGGVNYTGTATNRIGQRRA